MKKLLVAAITLSLTLPAAAQETRVLTQEEIQELLEEAEEKGFQVQRENLDLPPKNLGPGVINPGNYSMFSDASVFCNDEEKLGMGPLSVPENEAGEPDATQLPDHCSLKHNLVARTQPPEPRAIVNRRIIRRKDEISPPVDEPAPTE